MPESERKVSAGITTAVFLSLLAGIWMLVVEMAMVPWAMDSQNGWTWGHGMMRNWMPALWWPWFGVVAGVLVLFGAAMIYVKPNASRGWGLLILVVSALNFFIGMGGFIAGILGVVGGAFAVSAAGNSKTP